MAALAANRALRTGTTSCGPAWTATSSSTSVVSMVKSRGLVDEVAEVAEQLDVGRLVAHRARVLLVPLVEPGLELVATGQQLAVAGDEVAQDRLDAGPEGGLIDTRPGQRLDAHELMQDGGDLEASDSDAVNHDESSLVASLP